MINMATPMRIMNSSKVMKAKRMMDYNLIKSKRKTISIYIKPGGVVEVRAPLRASKALINSFVTAKSEWIASALERLSVREANKKIIRLSPEEEKACCQKALQYFQDRCAYFAAKMGVQYETIKVSKAKTRWGSCNSKGNINFTYRLIFAPEDLIDYVVIHELAHLKEMNHSNRFWEVVEEIIPDYKERRRRLNEFRDEFEFIIS
ncbi:MAG: SprT family zinc-dependent metalloprotease [Eubacteriales bacterium]|nr:SprT family zinc-dependent metalloprotease [Eubacteriales bacterium]